MSLSRPRISIQDYVSSLPDEVQCFQFRQYYLCLFGHVSCDKEGGELLFNHLSLRAGKKATIITTNLAFNRWNEIIKDKVLVAAMVDRLTHKAYLVNMTGLSYRLKETQKMRQDK